MLGGFHRLYAVEDDVEAVDVVVDIAIKIIDAANAYGCEYLTDDSREELLGILSFSFHYRAASPDKQLLAFQKYDDLAATRFKCLEPGEQTLLLTPDVEMIIAYSTPTTPVLGLSPHSFQCSAQLS